MQASTPDYSQGRRGNNKKISVVVYLGQAIAHRVVLFFSFFFFYPPADGEK